MIGALGGQRQNQIREKAGFPARSRVSWAAWPNAGMAGWRRSADRTFLQVNSLQTGNLTGKFKVLGALETISEQNAAAVRGLIDQFPVKFNREKYCWDQGNV